MAQRKAEPEHYLGGAAVSNGIIWTLTMFMLTIGKYVPSHVFSITHILFCSLGGIIAGYLTARRSSENHIKVGYTTGLVSGLIYTVVTRVILGTFETNVWAWIGLVFGGLVGGGLRRIKVEKIMSFKSIQNR